MVYQTGPSRHQFGYYMILYMLGFYWDTNFWLMLGYQFDKAKHMVLIDPPHLELIGLNHLELCLAISHLEKNPESTHAPFFGRVSTCAKTSLKMSIIIVIPNSNHYSNPIIIVVAIPIIIIVIPIPKR